MRVPPLLRDGCKGYVARIVLNLFRLPATALRCAWALVQRLRRSARRTDWTLGFCPSCWWGGPLARAVPVAGCFDCPRCGGEL